MKILYGVQGTGNGHIARARAMSEAFKAHEVQVDFLFSGREPDKYFSMEAFGDYQTRRGFTFVTEKGSVNYTKTALNNNLIQFFKEVQHLDLSSYDLVINDFEPVSAWAARKQNKPCIGISHQNAFRYPVPQKGASWFDKSVIEHFAPSQHHLGLHWYHFDQPILPPIVHTLEHASGNEDFVLVYLPFESIEDISDLLFHFNQQSFVCYHPNVIECERIENIELRPLCHTNFHALGTSPAFVKFVTSVPFYAGLNPRLRFVAMALLCAHPCADQQHSGANLVMDPLGESVEVRELPHVEEQGLISYDAKLDLPLMGAPIRTGEVLYLGPNNVGPKEETSCFIKADLHLHSNGIVIRPHASETSPIPLTWSPFTLVQACRLHTHQADQALQHHRLFKVSIFQFGTTCIFAAQGQDPEIERARWVADVSRALRAFTQSLLTSFSIRTKPLMGAPWTNTRLVAGYLLMCDDDGVSLIYAELHGHSDGSAAWVCYENEGCVNQVMRLNIRLESHVSERVGIDCSCFGFDTHHFSARTAAEKQLWLRAISNVKVKLRHGAPNPSAQDLHHYRSSIQTIANTINERCVAEPAPPMLPRKTAFSSARGHHIALKDIGPSFGSLPKVRRLEKDDEQEPERPSPESEIHAQESGQSATVSQSPLSKGVRAGFLGLQQLREPLSPVRLGPEALEADRPPPMPRDLSRSCESTGSWPVRRRMATPASPQSSIDPEPAQEAAKHIPSLNQAVACSPRLPSSPSFRSIPLRTDESALDSIRSSVDNPPARVWASSVFAPASIAEPERPSEIPESVSKPRQVQPSSLAATMLMTSRPQTTPLMSKQLETRSLQPWQDTDAHQQQVQRQFDKETHVEAEMQMDLAIQGMVKEAASMKKVEAGQGTQNSGKQPARKAAGLESDESRAEAPNMNDDWLRRLPDEWAETNTDSTTDSTKSYREGTSSEEPEAGEEDFRLAQVADM